MIKNISLDIVEVNQLASFDPKALVAKEESKFNSQIRRIASQVVANGKRIILISGASSAGKTTTSHILQNKLASLGVSSFVMSMDDFFVDRDTLPIREDGKHDIENLVALDVKAIRKCLGEIISKGETKIPQFDFYTHKRKKEWRTCRMHGNEVVLMEGLHALNPAIIDGLDLDKIFRLYIYCGGGYTYKEDNLLSPKDLRLLRRVIRDKRDRNAPILETLSLWDEVCKGEDKNITPYVDKADFKLNSFHSYELLLYKNLLSEQFKNYSDNKKIKMFLSAFQYVGFLSEDILPRSSVIREFVGYK